MKRKLFIIGIGLIAFGIIGFLVLFSDTENISSLIVGCVVFIFSGIVCILTDKSQQKNPVPQKEKTVKEQIVWMNQESLIYHTDKKCRHCNPEKNTEMQIWKVYDQSSPCKVCSNKKYYGMFPYEKSYAAYKAKGWVK